MRRTQWKFMIGIIGGFIVLFGFILTIELVINNPYSSEENAPTAENPTQTIIEGQETTSSKTDAAPKSLADLVKAYGDVPLIDAHNHDAGNYYSRISLWKRNSVDHIVLFGNVSEPSAVETDEMAWQAYEQFPDRIIPFTSGINLLEESGLDAARSNLEKGFFGIGEIAAASSHSPVLANVAWKTEHPMDGILPQLYELAAAYKAPLLLHIDPPNGSVMLKLEEALEANRETNIIFAHANAFNSPANIDALLAKHPNLYADFFAGFTVFNPGSTNQLEDFIPVIKKYPNRFVLSTDSGFGLEGGEEEAIEAMYLLIDALDDVELTRKIAYENMYALIEEQPVTAQQIEAIRKLDKDTERDVSTLTKLEAGKILIELSN